MKLLSERTQVNSGIDNWLSNYGLDGTYVRDTRGRKVGSELMALNRETATAADIAEIIGNDSWAHKQRCGECQTETWEIVEVGETPNYDSETALLCKKCVLDALRLFTPT